MTATCGWPDWLEPVWAKSPEAGKSVGETLAAHTWEALRRVADLARLRPGLPPLLELPRLWCLLFWAAFLHDWGKAATGFQQAVRGGPRWGHRHEVLSLVFLDWISQAFNEQEAAWLAAVIATHHRDLSEVRVLYPRPSEDEDDASEVLVRQLPREAVEGLWRWLAEVGESWIRALGLGDVVATVCTRGESDAAISATLVHGSQRIQHWLAACSRLIDDIDTGEAVSLRIGTLLLRGYLIQSDHTASAHADRLQPCLVCRKGVMQAAKLTADNLYAHQEQASQTTGSALLIAPTGSGKTEAALLWAARQAEARGSIPRLVYTLPYQASMNAMYDRLQATFRGRVGLLHGRSTLALYRRLMEHESTPQEATRQARWLRNLARLNVPPVRVSSPYQMLKAAYQLKGYEALLADYAQAAFIFDEIHAYEPARLAMILETTRYLREKLAAVFLVMTATLPGPVRSRVEEALDRPAIVRASRDLYRRFSRHSLRLLAGELLAEEGLQLAAEAYRSGRSVLVTCNTVRRAQEAYCSLVSRLPDVEADRIILVHGGYNSRDRLRKEGRILAAAGLGGGARQPVLVISTQVVEVSLNIDLDTLFSDPAPLEALVQRFGRVNRKGRLTLAPVHIFSEPADGQKVYDGRVVQAALQLLVARADGQAIDEASIQEWLDAIYQGPLLAEWERTFSRAAQEFRDAFLEPLRPFSAGSGLEDEFNRLFDGLEILPLSLRAEYEELNAERPLEAAELLVPISWRRWRGLQQAQRVDTTAGRWPPVVDIPYSPEMGVAHRA